MDNSNRKPTQGVSGSPVGDPSMESGDWRAQLQADSRQRMVNKIMESLKRHLPFSGHDGQQELKKIAERFEEKIYTAATSQSDYLRKISLKMMTMQPTSGLNPTDPGSQVMPQVNIQGQQLPVPVPSQSGKQQMMPQNMQNNIALTGMQGASGLSAALPTGSGLSQSTMSNIDGQNSNLQTMQNLSQMQQGSVGNTMGANNLANQRPPGRQQLVPQQQQQSQNSHSLYQQQLHQMSEQELQQNSVNPSRQSQMQQQQQQQQNLLQSGMQPTMMQTPSLSGVVQSQQVAVPLSSQPLLNHQQSVLRQQQRQQQMQPTKQQVKPTQSNPMGQQANALNMQQNLLIGPQNKCSDMQQQRLLGQQNNLSSIQQPQQHLIGQHDNLSGMQQHLGLQSNASGQQHLLGSQSGNIGMKTNQHSELQMLHSKMPIQQQNQQSSAMISVVKSSVGGA